VGMVSDVTLPATIQMVRTTDGVFFTHQLPILGEKIQGITKL
jgi:hypothetical protein